MYDYYRLLHELDDNSSRLNEDILTMQGTQNYFDYYTIKQGDTLYEIARKYNINPELLATLNGLNMKDYIYPKQVILIPKANYSYYITKSGDTLDSVSSTFGISVDKLLDGNDTIYLLEGQMLVNKVK